MAVRLSKAVGNDPDFWLRLQRQYDVAQVLKDAGPRGGAHRRDRVPMKELRPAG
jgi:plasmid maintenance system antidote protein VapI